MFGTGRTLTLAALGLSTISLCLALFFSQSLLLIAGLVGYVFIGMRYGSPRLIERGKAIMRLRRQAEQPVDDPVGPPVVKIDREETDELVEEILRRGRYALLLRPQLAGTLRERHVDLGLKRLQETMSVVPQGKVMLGADASMLEDFRAEDLALRDAHPEGTEVWVDGLFLDRYPVTNEQYQHFVDDNGYEQMELWATEVWPALLDFVDRTDHPGPRYWRDGRYPEGLAKHPVVGICWYEAAAYARWAGKRLPTDAEWVKAGCWPAELGGEGIVQREYPWGHTMDRAKAHLWSTESHGPVPVTEYADGVSVGGAHQLIGNVWEWTSSNFGTADMYLIAEGAVQKGQASRLKSVRGGAFDTYFENQASCHFQSGDQSIARKHNIGFRCALSMCDVVGYEPVEDNIAELEEAAEATPVAAE